MYKSYEIDRSKEMVNKVYRNSKGEYPVFVSDKNVVYSKR